MPAASIPKRRHHYVWRHYLRAWARDEKIWCRANEKIINPGLMSVAQERDFYRFQVLNDKDIEFIRVGIIDLAMPMLRELHVSSLKQYLLVQSGLLLARSYKGNDIGLDSAAEALECNFLEDWHGSVEERAIPHLNSLLRGDTTFYQEQDSCIDFAIYFATQHLRTQKHRDLILDPGSPIPAIPANEHGPSSFICSRPMSRGTCSHPAISSRCDFYTTRLPWTS